MSVATAMSIAGSDPSGGAGIQADLKSFSARGVYGMAAITALTAQNTQGVAGVHVVPADFVSQQIRTVFDDIDVHAVKIGMIANAEIALAVAEALAGFSGAVVLDPVMVAKGGNPLLPEQAVSALRAKLLPLATVLTPNLPEAGALLGERAATSRETMKAQGLALLEHGPKAVFMKGGHLEAADCPDLLVTRETEIWLDGPRFKTKNTHGTGCSISSAIAAELAKGKELAEAVTAARRWLQGAIESADSLGIGHGHGPTHHFYALWPVA
ncbi:bifunctional hydroxymethylpyrimidine kinase/phosphomethylpyrimidine kinase [Aliiruegeria sabulilitoris]|uniref:bifunctional hydroxymethylpyrimidine kinase/phosphomethylpyrimidine kinase n=1 Tax=Aliiruegeria sabulilitoris TaxID=1510458 RepID=UPI000A606D8E|nr:bifunctional hydroxymethylpyrimidine kinase/phosphomethylpyrimidine kinase [Aliiruegeria sabulilitoris]NDR59152.1 bifunctional hydroxymethylpyrimidine kinase/phosphomethylpyrimidine kinase [Pseudoruegeria sp. M32A2M]